MKDYKKTIIGSIITFVLGTSCCWLSSLAIWVGGFALISTFVQSIERIQTSLILLSIAFGIVSIFLYYKNIRKGSKEKKTKTQ